MEEMNLRTIIQGIQAVLKDMEDTPKTSPVDFISGPNS